MFDRAQGTIEYLVVIAVVVVVSLVVVGLSISVTASPAQQISNSSGALGNLANGEITIVEAALDSKGNVIMELKNTTADYVTVTKITAGGKEKEITHSQIGSVGGSRVINVNVSGGDCVCGSEDIGKTKVCEIKFDITKDTGIELSSGTKKITVECIADIPDTSPPVVSLLFPVDKGSYRSAGGFLSFSSTDDMRISSCTVLCGGESQTFTDLNNGINTVKFNSVNYNWYTDWNVSCTDGTNTVVSESRKIKVDANVNPFHCVDYRSSFGVIDSTEVTRVIGYRNAGGYYVNPAGSDGYSTGIGSHEGPYHCADTNYDWAISTDELTVIQALWSCGSYVYDSTSDSWSCP